MKKIILSLIIINFLYGNEVKNESNLSEMERIRINFQKLERHEFKHTVFRNSLQNPFDDLTKQEQSLDLLLRIKLKKIINPKKILFLGKHIDKYISDIKKNDEKVILDVCKTINEQNISSWKDIIIEMKKSEKNNDTNSSNNYNINGNEFKVNLKGKLFIQKSFFKNSMETKFQKLTKQEQALDLLLRVKLRKMIKPKQMLFMGIKIEKLISDVKNDDKKIISKILYNTSNKNVNTWDDLFKEIQISKNRVKILKRIGMYTEPKLKIDTSSITTKVLKNIFKAL